MKKKRTIDDELQAACRAHTDLNVFYGIIALLEGGLIHAESYPAADRIIAICKKECGRCVKQYDAARARAIVVNQQIMQEEK